MRLWRGASQSVLPAAQGMAHVRPRVLPRLHRNVSDDRRSPTEDAEEAPDATTLDPVESAGTSEAPADTPAGPRGPSEAANVLREAARAVRPRLGFPVRSIGSVLVGATFGRLFRSGRAGTRRLRALVIGVVIASLSLVTCSWGVDPGSLTASYGPPILASTAAAERLLARSAAAVRSLPETRTLRLSASDVEATSALSLGMMMPELIRATQRMSPAELRGATDLENLRERLRAKEAEAREAELRSQSFARRFLARLDPQIRTGDVQVRFKASGQIVVAGYVQAWRFRQPAMFVVAPHARSGELSMDFVEGRLGRVPAPEFAFDLLGDLLSSLILLGQDYAEISELTVGDGTLHFVGRVVG